MTQTLRLETAEIEQKPNLKASTILLCPNLVKIDDHKLTNCNKILYLHAPNLEEVGKNGLYHCFSLTNVNFPKLRTLEYMSICSARCVKVVILGMKNLCQWAFIHCGGLRYV